jgi:cysteine desulfurase/selenocysteine lyase
VREERLGDIEPAVIDDVGAAWTSPDSYALRGDARRFETHEHEPALRLGLGAAAEYALSLGVENICRQVRALAEDVRQELEKAAADITSALQEKGIWVKTIPRAGALMDTTARDIEELVRISPHYFNTDRELETCLAAIREVTGR